MNSFNTAYNRLMEALNASGSAFGTPMGVTPSVFSSDLVYAPGDARIPHALGAKKRKKGGQLKFKIHRRKLSVQ